MAETIAHGRPRGRLDLAAWDALGEEWAVVGEVDVVLPEAVVAAARRAEASDVLAVVEVVSPGSRRTDHVAKLAEYARAGIEHYVVVDPGPPLTTTEFRRGPDGAHEPVSHPDGAPVRLTSGPVLDPAALLRR